MGTGNHFCEGTQNWEYQTFAWVPLENAEILAYWGLSSHALKPNRNTIKKQINSKICKYNKFYDKPIIKNLIQLTVFYVFLEELYFFSI